MVARARRGRDGVADEVAPTFGLQLVDVAGHDEFDALGFGRPDAEAAFLVLVGR